ncbi:MAG: BrnT family toxin, partial [Truepera sp.]|nr:BrnT family toxin [Truepera sp.]
MEFEWDDANIDHIANHGVEPFEAEEAATDRARTPFPAHSGNVGLIGKTEGGRLLVVILERKSRLWRVVTAR